MRRGKGAAAAAIALMALAIAAAGAAGQEAAPAEPDEAAPPGASPNPLSSLDLESLSATRELPLFTPSRTPPLVEEPPPPEPEPEPVEPEIVEEADPEPPPLELIGIVVTEAEQVVLLMDQSTGEVQRIRPGDEFEGWTVSIIDSRTVELESEGNFQTLTMFTGTGDPADPNAALDEEMWDDGSEFEEFDEGGQNLEDPTAGEPPAELPTYDEGFEDESVDGSEEEMLDSGEEAFQEESLIEE